MFYLELNLKIYEPLSSNWAKVLLEEMIIYSLKIFIP